MNSKTTYNPKHPWPFPKGVSDLTQRQISRRKKEIHKREIKAAPAAPF